MGMTCNFVSLEVSDFNSILENPERAISLIEFESEGLSIEYQARLDEARRLISDPSTPAEMKPRYEMFVKNLSFNPHLENNGGWKLGPETKTLGIDKSWHGMHTLLMMDEPDDSLRNFILGGGQTLDSEDFGYGPPHGFTLAETKTIAQVLGEIDVDRLVTLENLKKIESDELYCFSVEEDQVEYIHSYLTELKEFVINAANADQALFVYLA